MSRFRFRLEAVRELREHAELQAKEQLAVELSEARDRSVAASQAAERLEAARLRAARPGEEALPAHELAAQRAFVERRERERRMAVAHAHAQERRVEDSRASLQRAARDHETLVRAKARARAEHDHEAQRRASDALDDLTIMRHNRAAGER